MSSCIDLKLGYEVPCVVTQRRYVQRVVLINKSDVEESIVERSSVGIDDVFTCRHHILFKLKTDKKGFQISSSVNGFNVFGTFSRSEKDNVVEYLHTVQFPSVGVDVTTKCFLQQLDFSFYFAALMLTDGTVEIYGFENGLRLGDYKVDVQNTMGGTGLSLVSGADEQEIEMPYIYKNLTSTESEDFDNLFEDIAEISGGDFNNDFNNDFLI